MKDDREDPTMTPENQPQAASKSWQLTFWATAILTIPMLGLIASTYWWHSGGGSAALYGLVGFNLLSLIAFPLIYIGGLVLYIRRLRSLLGHVPEQSRVLPADSVWLIAVVPVNFVGSFFVIAGIARSLASARSLDPSSIRRWRYLGLAWCVFQVLTFVPIMSVSFISVLVSYVFWAAHWVYSVRLDEQSSTSEAAHE